MLQFAPMLVFCVVSGTLFITSSENVPKKITLRGSADPEAIMSTPELIEYFGYPVETHVITTTDGYVIEIHRIPFGINASEGPKTPVIVQHGILCSSADSVINFPHQSIGFVLADAGYDVWLTNIRGNIYGRNHTKYNPDVDDAFWKFSWDEMAAYDMPAIIDYILNATSYSQLYYAGHSMGSTIALAMLSTKTQYNDKIKAFLAIAPVATLIFAKTAVKYLAPFWEDYTVLSGLIGNQEFLPSNDFIRLLAQGCDNMLNPFCENVLFLICGYNPDELNSTRMDVYVSHSPAGTSAWTVNHYAQIILSSQFRMYSWGLTKNIARYGQITPPLYNVTKITTPTIIFWGNNDYLASPEDVKLLANRLLSLKGSYEIADPHWAHLDFLWGINANTLFLPQLIERMPKF